MAANINKLDMLTIYFFENRANVAGNIDTSAPDPFTTECMIIKQ